MDSLAVGMRDASGQLYMRNRYYDPQTGQFTQPDPIGLAGGMNVYGFAAGDPVSYSDPYGLNPCLIYPKACDIAAGAVMGAVMGAATQALSNAANDRPLTEGVAGAAVTGGAVGGALGGVGTLIRAARGASVLDDVANAAQSATPRRGAAAVLRARGRTFTGTSGARTVNPRVQQMLDDVPVSQRSGFHGKCAEINCLSQAADAGVDVSGGTVSVVRVRAPGNPGHGSTMAPCPTCAHVLNQAGVRVVP
jgi:RHS repeat-associated protein